MLYGVGKMKHVSIMSVGFAKNSHICATLTDVGFFMDTRNFNMKLSNYTSN